MKTHEGDSKTRSDESVKAPHWRSKHAVPELIFLRRSGLVGSAVDTSSKSRRKGSILEHIPVAVPGDGVDVAVRIGRQCPHITDGCHQARPLASPAWDGCAQNSFAASPYPFYTASLPPRAMTVRLTSLGSTSRGSHCFWMHSAAATPAACPIIEPVVLTRAEDKAS